MVDQGMREHRDEHPAYLAARDVFDLAVARLLLRVKQIGHGVDQWPLVIFKELTDNALDACEEGHVEHGGEVADRQPLPQTGFGIHHHVAGPYLSAYASEMAWRENNRRVSNGVSST
jgi:hypothetical protein